MVFKNEKCQKGLTKILYRVYSCTDWFLIALGTSLCFFKKLLGLPVIQWGFKENIFEKHKEVSNFIPKCTSWVMAQPWPTLSGSHGCAGSRSTSYAAIAEMWYAGFGCLPGKIRTQQIRNNQRRILRFSTSLGLQHCVANP